MDLSMLPDDFMVTSNQFKKTTYRDEYAIAITGVIQGLGREAFAPAFAKANAKAIVVIACNDSGLQFAAGHIRKINPSVKVLTQAIDIRDVEAVRVFSRRIKSKLGRVDVFINNAGLAKTQFPIRENDPEDFWNDFEVNVKGTLHMTQEFLKLVGEAQPATIINIISGVILSISPYISSYSLSKLVLIQMQRFVAAENDNFMAVSLQPGIYITAIAPPAFYPFAKDSFRLAGGTAVSLALEKARRMNGKYMVANGSVDEMIERKYEITLKG